MAFSRSICSFRGLLFSLHFSLQESKIIESKAHNAQPIMGTSITSHPAVAMVIKIIRSAHIYMPNIVVNF